MKAENRNNMYAPVRRMIRKLEDTKITQLIDNSKTYNQIDQGVIETLHLSYNDQGQLYNVEGEIAEIVDLVFDANGRLESVLETNKVTDRALETTFEFDEITGQLITVIPNLLNEGSPPGYDEEEDDTTDYEPPVPNEEDVELDPPTDGTTGDYDWTDRDGEGELM